MALSDIFRPGALRRKTEDHITSERVLAGALTVGHIIEIQNGYLLVISGGMDHEYKTITLYVPTLEKVGEALAAHRTKQKFLHEPETVYMTNKVKTSR